MHRTLLMIVAVFLLVLALAAPAATSASTTLRTPRRWAASRAR